MKYRKAKITLAIILCIVLLYVAYQYFSWNKMAYNNLPLTRGVESIQFEQPIQSAEQNLKTIPEKLNVPSVSVAVGVEGQLVWSAAYGYADLENKIAASPKTTYRIGSTSKAVTSTALMRLVQSGGLDLDQEVSQLVKDYPEKAYEFTTRQLLSHTAGFPDYEDLGISGAWFTLTNLHQFYSVEEGLKVFKDRPLLFEPDTEFKYNSFDLVMASRVLEVNSGLSFSEFLQAEVFQPLGMENIYLDHGGYRSAEEAEFYQMKPGAYRGWHFFGLPNRNQNLSYKWAGGGIVASPTDLVKMGNALVNDSAFISFDIRNEFFTPKRLASGEVNEQRYALGWRSYKDHGSAYLLGEEQKFWMVHHGGVSKGSMNLLLLFPDQQLVVDVAINGRTKDFDFSPFWIEVMKMTAPFLDQLVLAKKIESE